MNTGFALLPDSVPALLDRSFPESYRRKTGKVSPLSKAVSNAFMRQRTSFLTLLLVLAGMCASAQEVRFPEDFKAPAGLFPDMILYPLPPGSKAKRLLCSNPGFTNQKMRIRALSPLRLREADVEALYYEFYRLPRKSHHNAQVLVFAFRSTAALEAALTKIIPSFNEIYLRKGRYLICAGSDFQEEASLPLIEAHYTALGAVVCVPPEKL